MVDSAHDLSEGGLAAALVESSLRYGVGARIALQDVLDRDGVDLFTALFSESQGRAIVAVPRSEEIRFTDMCTARGFPHIRIGVVDADGGTLDINGVETMTSTRSAKPTRRPCRSTSASPHRHPPSTAPQPPF